MAFSSSSVKIELRHAAAPRDALVRTALDEGLDGLVAEAHVDVAQFGREVGALTQQGVATDAVVLFPERLAERDLLGDGLGLSRCGVLPEVSNVRARNSRKKKTVPPKKMFLAMILVKTSLMAHLPF